MQTDLRPMSLGEILDRTAQLYRNNFLLFAGIAAIYSGVLLFINLAQIGVNSLLLKLQMASKVPLVSLAFVILILPLIFVCAGAAIAANNRAVAWVNLGQPATIVAAYRSILPRLGRYLWMMTIMGFIIYLPFVLLATAYGAFLFVYGKSRGVFATGGANSHPEAFVVVGIVSIVFFLLATAYMVYAIFMGLRYSLAIPAAVVEDLKARKSIRRSIELSKGSRGRIFLLGLLIFAIQLGIVLLTQSGFIIAFFVAAKKHGEISVWLQVAQQIVGFFTNSFIGPMYATGLTLFYYDQRIRKEGFDIEWMMQAAGMNALAAPAEPTPEPAADEAVALAPPAESQANAPAEVTAPETASGLPQENSHE
jgi:hypothetical protein